MSLIKVIGITSTLIAATFVASASAQEQQPPQQPPAAAPAAPAAPPPFATTKVEGTDNVYIFRYGGHQSMFIVTPAGVIATDPISERRPAKPYIDAIQAVTKAPIKYVIYSHSHYDHIAGGKPFKDMGATFVAHKNAKARSSNSSLPTSSFPTRWSTASATSRSAAPRSNSTMSARTIPTACW